MSFLTRYNTYQKERFPLIAYSFLIATLIFAIASISNNFELLIYLRTFVVAILIFFLLRVADEFKDYEDDCKYRSYRAVPRGLVSLKELGIAGAVTLISVISLVLSLDTGLILPLLLVLGYWTLMSFEFFSPKWLKAHPLIYLLSHMVLMPLIVYLLLTMMNAPQSNQFYIFILLSFLNGVVLEIGRKIRQKSEEEVGVDTYSALWGKKKALIVLNSVLALTTITTLAIIGSGVIFYIAFFILILLFISTLLLSKKFLKIEAIKGKKIDTLSAIWLLITYILIGLSGVL